MKIKGSHLIITISLFAFAVSNFLRENSVPGKNIKNIYLIGGLTLGDIAGQSKLVKPLVSTPYIPTEVKSIDQSEKKISLDNMADPEIIGQTPSNENTNKKKEEENPQIYSTVIHQRPTTIQRPMEAVQNSISLNAMPQLLPGTHSVPVKINSIVEGGQPIPNGYIRPSFDIAAENIPNNSIFDSESKMTAATNTLKADFLSFSENLSKMGYDNKQMAIQSAIKRMGNDIDVLNESIQKDQTEIDKIEGLVIKMKELLKKFEAVYKTR